VVHASPFDDMEIVSVTIPKSKERDPLKIGITNKKRFFFIMTRVMRKISTPWP
jgi:hypothetical protein